MQFIKNPNPNHERTNIIHHFKLNNAFRVEVHPQDRGVWLIDIETTKDHDLSVSFLETFDMEEMVNKIEADLL